MNAPIARRQIRRPLWAWPAHLPPAAEVPLLDLPDAAAQGAEDARFIDSFLRAEAGRVAPDGGDTDG